MEEGTSTTTEGHPTEKENSLPWTQVQTKTHKPEKCYLCLDKLPKKGYSRDKANLFKIKTACSLCKKMTCNKHFYLACFECASNLVKRQQKDK